MNNGYIVLHRKIRDWRWYRTEYMFYFFTELLFMANYTERYWMEVKIPRGSFVTSLDNLSNELGLSVRQCRTALSRLEKTGEIITKSTSKYTTITITNYDTYQSSQGTKRQTNDKPTTNQRQQHNTGNKGNEIKEIHMVKFEEFWDAYDKKTGRKDCEDWYRKNHCDHSLIMDGLAKWKRSGNWSDKQYQFKPINFLKKEYWKEEPPLRNVINMDGTDQSLIDSILRGEK